MNPRRIGRLLDPTPKTTPHAQQKRTTGGNVGELDFRFGGIGAPLNGLKAFATTGQLALPDKIANAVALATSPVVKVRCVVLLLIERGSSGADCYGHGREGDADPSIYPH